jgi:hypothetical protein
MFLPRRFARGITIGLVGLALAGCEGDDGTSVDPNTPVIAFLAFTFGGACTTAVGAGTGTNLTLSFSDADGNVSGGRATIATTLGQQTTSLVIDAPIPSANVTISGTTAGTITVIGCVTFGSSSSFTQVVTVTDTSGRTSDQLSVTVGRPLGVPQLPTPGRTLPNGG